MIGTIIIYNHMILQFSKSGIFSERKNEIEKKI